jgi:pimeloyl-ACP methyl ester carboxylesterase
MAALAALLALPALFPAAPAHVAAASLGCANVTQPAIVTGTTPVLFVHGINSDYTAWTQGSVGLTQKPPLDYVDSALGTRQQVTGYTFDWSQYSGLKSGSELAWVTSPPAPGPGPLLAQAITCVAQKSGHKVIIIAHSMGGLLTEYASRSAASDIAAVFTLGTPYAGSWLDSLAVGPLLPVSQSIAATCAFGASSAGGQDVKKHAKTGGAISGSIESLCRVVGQRDDPGMVAMRTDAKDGTGWNALQKTGWPSGLPVYPLAASIQETWQPLPFGLLSQTLLDLGDGVVGTSSELNGGTKPTTTCTVPVASTDAVSSFIDLLAASSCFHTSEPDNQDLLASIVTTIGQQHLIPTIAPGSLPVVSCPTSLGIDRPAVTLPQSRPVAVPQALAAGLSVYADTQGIMEVLGPKGWSCTAAIGVDGSGGVTVYPAGADPSSPVAITGSETSVCVGCTLAQACPLFPSAATASRSDLGEACPAHPAAETVAPVAAGIVSFEDPPGVKGDGQPSGGQYPADGVMTYHPSAQEGSWQETCTLPASEKDICTAVLNTFVSWYGQR